MIRALAILFSNLPNLSPHVLPGGHREGPVQAPHPGGSAVWRRDGGPLMQARGRHGAGECSASHYTSPAFASLENP